MRRTVSYSLSVLEMLTLPCFRLDPYVTLLVHNSLDLFDPFYIPYSAHHLLREISNETYCESRSSLEASNYVS